MDVMGGGREAAFSRPLSFAVALMGCVTLGWSLTLFAGFRAAHELGARGGPVWRFLTLGMLVWYGLDSTLSVATGFGVNAVSNTLLLAGYLAPLLASGVLSRGDLSEPHPA